MLSYRDISQQTETYGDGGKHMSSLLWPMFLSSAYALGHFKSWKHHQAGFPNISAELKLKSVLYFSHLPSEVSLIHGFPVYTYPEGTRIWHTHSSHQKEKITGEFQKTEQFPLGMFQLNWLFPGIIINIISNNRNVLNINLLQNTVQGSGDNKNFPSKK